MTDEDRLATDDFVVLLGHGSRRGGANRALEGMAGRVAGRLGTERVVAAFLQFARPTLAEAVETCIGAGARRVAVVPFFLLPGTHVVAEIPAELVRLRQVHEGVEIVQGDILGGHPAVVEAAADRAREVLR